MFIFLRSVLFLVFLASMLSGCVAALFGGAAAGGAIHDRRTFGAVLDDQSIELGAFDALNKDKEIALQNNVEAVSHNGTLLLIGEVASEELRSRAESIVKPLDGVTRVVNELEVRPVPGALSATKDRWISLKVKSSLVGIKDVKGFDATRVNVTTQRGIVYLMGLVTPTEADRVTDVVRNVDGVKRVVKVFEYISK